MKNNRLVRVLFLTASLSPLWSIGFSQNVTVNPGAGSYATLKAAFDAINAGTHTGAITIDIVGNTTETAPAVLNASGTGSASYTSILMQPSGGAARTISGAIAAGSPLVDFNGADNVTVNGLNNAGNALTIENTTASPTASTSTIRFINGATSNTVTNCTVLGAFSATVATIGGTIFFATDANTTGGNDNNTISSCNIGPSGANLPTKGIFGTGTTTTVGHYNSGIMITGNNIFDYFGAAVASAGIYFAAGCTDWTISNNKLYQTATRTQTTGAIHAGIQLASANINNCVISGNTIGYASNSGTGTYTFVGIGSGSRFYPVYLSTHGTTTATSIQGNTVTAINLSGPLSGTSTSSSFAGILISSGLANIGNTTGNTVGSSTIAGAITYSSSGTTTNDLYGIYFFPSASCTIANNIVGGIAGTNTSTGSLDIYGLRAFTTGTATNTFTNNTVGYAAAPITNSSAATGSNLYGIYSQSGASVLTGNAVAYLTASAANIGTTSAASVIGIWMDNSATIGNNVAQNTIHDLHNSAATAAVWVTGLHYSGSTSGTNTVQRNQVYALTVASTSATAVVNGIYNQAGSTTYRNNMIAIGAGIPNANIVNGINAAAGTDNYYHNSVYIGGAPTAGTGNSFAFTSAATTVTRNYRDNIFYNARNNSGASGKNYIVFVAGTAANPAGLTINNNLYYSTGTGGFFGLFNAVDIADLPTWRTAVGQDVASFQSNPQYLDPANALPDLHLNPSVITYAEANGFDVGVTDDYDGQTRSGLTPTDIGADAGNFMGADVTGPGISYTPLPNTACPTPPVLTATITDATGINIMPGTMPRLWYRKSTNMNVLPGTNDNTTDGWKYVEASNASSPFNFSFDYSLVNGGVVSGDVIHYFVVAQDIVTPSNVSINQGTFNAPPSSVALGGSSFPVTGNLTYTLLPTLATSITIGASGTYPSLTGPGGFFAAANTAALSGNTTVTLSDAVITETGANALNTISYACGGPYTLTIQPAPATAVVLSGTSGASVSALIKLNGADNVTINGLNTGGASLTIENTSVTTGTAVVWLASVGAGNGCTNNTITNCTIKAGIAQNASTNVTYGIVMAGGTLSATITSITAGNDNDNNTFSNNTFIKARYALHTRGGSTTNLNTGTVITGNTFGPTAFGVDAIGKGAIITREEDGIQIKNNVVQFVGGDFANMGTGADRVGITIGTDASWTPTAVLVKNAVITGNILHDIVDELTFSAVGIAVAAADGTNETNNLVANNFIYNIKGNGTSGDQTVGIGMNASRGDKVVFNTLYLTGDTDPHASATTPNESNFGISIASTNVVNPVVKNNIIYMDLSSSSAPAIKYADINIPTAFAWGTGGSNNNNLYYNPSNSQSNTGCVAGTGGTFHLTLANWQTASSQDANSVNIQPAFNSSSDLHLLPGGNQLMDNLGTPIAGVTNDIDNDVRNVSTPDMGADEFMASGGVDMGATALVAPGPVTGCYSATETVTVTIRNYSSATMDFAVNPVTVTVTATGGYNQMVNINSGTLASGATQNVVMPGTIDMTLTNNYIFNASTSSGADLFAGNDAMSPTSRNVIALTGSYTVGAGGNYTTLTAAVAAYNTMNCNPSNVTFLLTDATYTTGETFPITINNNTVAGTNTLTIRPANATAVTISTSNSTTMIDLNGGDRVTIDGINADGSTLLIRNTSTSGSVIRMINDATNNLITNATIEGAVTSTTSGLVVFSTAATGTSGNSNNTVSRCSLRDRSDATGVPNTCIYSSGTSTALNSNNTIQFNNLFNFSGSGVNASATGYGNNWTISNNHIYNSQATPSASTQNGIVIPAGTGHVINGNFIGGNAPAATGTWSNSGAVTVIGINNTGGVVTISNNTVANITSTSTSTSARLRGISTTSEGENVLIDNNDVFNLLASGAVAAYTAASQTPIGIYAFPATTFHLYRITHNEVHDISNENTSALTTSNLVVGIELTNFTGECAYNKIWNIRNKTTGITAGQPPIATGIYSRFHDEGYVYNNMIAVGEGESNNVQYCGAVVVGTGDVGNNQFYLHNTIRVSGTATGTWASYGFLRGDNTATSTSHPVHLFNNLISMERSGGGSSNYAIASQGTTPGAAVFESNYNDLYSVNASTLGLWDATAYTFAGWQGVSGQDANSLNVAPTFVSATDLHLTAANVALDNMGTPIPDIDDDFDAEPRNFISPDMGFDEFTTGCTNVVMNTFDSGAGSLRDVIACLANGDYARFDASLLNQSIVLTTGEIVLDKSVGLLGLGKNNLTISGNNASRIFHLQSGKTLRALDLSLRNTTELSNGGAIWVEGNLIMTNTLLENNFENGVPKALTLITPGALEIKGAVELNE